MSRARFTFRVHNDDVVDDIRDAIIKGMGRSTQPIADDVIDTAQDRIKQAGAVWTGELLEGFNWSLEAEGNRLSVIVENTSDHARPIEFGAEYGSQGPPLAPLIPWVRTKMVGFSIPDDDLPDMPDPEDIKAEADVEWRGEDWGPESIDVAQFTDQETLQKAFWLQQHIKENGIRALRYMKVAELEAEQKANMTVARYISQELRKL